MDRFQRFSTKNKNFWKKQKRLWSVKQLHERLRIHLWKMTSDSLRRQYMSTQQIMFRQICTSLPSLQLRSNYMERITIENLAYPNFRSVPFEPNSTYMLSTLNQRLSKWFKKLHYFCCCPMLLFTASFRTQVLYADESLSLICILEQVQRSYKEFSKHKTCHSLSTQTCIDLGIVQKSWKGNYYLNWCSLGGCICSLGWYNNRYSGNSFFWFQKAARPSPLQAEARAAYI